MFVPPEERGPWHPPRPEDRPGSGDSVLLFLVCLFLLCMFLAPIGGGNLVDAFLAVMHG